jgi:hydrogenase maturation protease
MRKPVFVACFGNPLHGGDNLGFQVYQRLLGHAWTNGINLQFVGVDGLRALEGLEHCQFAVFVDALAHAGHPGRIHLLRPAALANAADAASLSHAAGIPWLLQAAQSVCQPLPPIVIVGAEIDAIRPFNPWLSPLLERAADRIAALLRRCLRQACPSVP